MHEKINGNPTDKTQFPFSESKMRAMLFPKSSQWTWNESNAISTGLTQKEAWFVSVKWTVPEFQELTWSQWFMWDFVDLGNSQSFRLWI